MKTEITEEREKDIQTLCQLVLNTSTKFFDNPNGGYEYSCPFCYKMLNGPDPMKSWVELKEIDHLPNCAYLIAKDLSTNL